MTLFLGYTITNQQKVGSRTRDQRLSIWQHHRTNCRIHVPDSFHLLTAVITSVLAWSSLAALMSIVPSRSARGCLTCKQRRKKCDEIKPYCERCVSGGFLCLGYSNTIKPRASAKRFLLESVVVESALASGSNEPVHVSSASESTSSSGSSLPPTYFARTMGNHGGLFDQQIMEHFGNIPKTVSVEPAVLSEMLPLIISQCVRAGHEGMFRPFPLERFKAGLTWRVNSPLATRWTLYLSARVAEFVFEGGRKEQVVCVP
ncbi:hypothetical protein BDV93DRAFT_558812 [Ceratobasidium sp. AG-I]|nr:hypothetical protein BDV93DRAFT_558812 [Ceratobasidium sp. AG-I]